MHRKRIKGKTYYYTTFREGKVHRTLYLGADKEAAKLKEDSLKHAPDSDSPGLFFVVLFVLLCGLIFLPFDFDAGKYVDGSKLSWVTGTSVAVDGILGFFSDNITFFIFTMFLLAFIIVILIIMALTFLLRQKKSKKVKAVKKNKPKVSAKKTSLFSRIFSHSKQKKPAKSSKVVIPKNLKMPKPEPFKYEHDKHLIQKKEESPNQPFFKDHFQKPAPKWDDKKPYGQVQPIPLKLFEEPIKPIPKLPQLHTPNDFPSSLKKPFVAKHPVKSDTAKEDNPFEKLPKKIKSKYVPLKKVSKHYYVSKKDSELSKEQEALKKKLEGLYH